MNKMSDEELVERLKQGDEQAFDLLYEKHYPYLYYVAFKLTHNQEDAKDAVQLSFIQMYESIHSLQNPKYFRLWMNKIVHGKCYNMFKKNRDVIVDLEGQEWANRYHETKKDFLPQERINFTSDQDILQSLIAKLPYPSQEILELHYFSQLKQEEIAKVLNLPIGTVKSRVYAAKKALRKEIKAYEEEHHYKLTFHFPGMLSLALWLSYHKGFCQAISKKTFLSSLTANSVVLITSALILSPLVIHAGLQVLNEQENSSIQNNEAVAATSLKDETTAQQAYFRLKQIAYDESQMMDREAAIIEEATHLYHVIEQTKGPYWELLKKDGWTLNFKISKK